jgi:RHS repeat-associated protein
VQETVWLGDIPVATLRPNGSSVNIFYVHSDHLNTPRKVSRPSDNKLEWRWDADPFGTAAVNQNPQGLGTFTYNLRFPGQYYMAETGINQNWNRDYDPLTGKYVQSDPIGLPGGINTYSYAGSSPLLFADPFGTQATAAVPVVVGGAAIVVCYASGLCQQVSQGLQNMFSRGHSDPVSGEVPYNPGRDCNGNCNPCKPNQYWEASGNAHGSTSGTHWHGLIWNQNPGTCECHPKRVSGSSLDDVKSQT